MIVKKHIDAKYHAEVATDGLQTVELRIVKSGNGVAVPDDEPMMLFRGRDRLAVRALKFYRELCVLDGCNDYQLGLLDALIGSFEAFAETSPTKQPGVTRGL